VFPPPNNRISSFPSRISGCPALLACNYDSEITLLRVKVHHGNLMMKSDFSNVKRYTGCSDSVHVAYYAVVRR
jgi:hypothetical protein